MTETLTLADPVEGLFALMNRKGAARYGAEAVSQLQHALQAAAQAEREGETPALVAAALLHDVGHLVADDEAAAPRGVDAHHENVAARYLRRWFGPGVTEPIRLHVAAKRYLCTAEGGYREKLSFASERSLMLQGGPFSPEEATAFRANPFAAEAIKLRRWDELAKDPAAATPGLDHYLHLVRSVRRP